MSDSNGKSLRSGHYLIDQLKKKRIRMALLFMALGFFFRLVVPLFPMAGFGEYLLTIGEIAIPNFIEPISKDFTTVLAIAILSFEFVAATFFLIGIALLSPKWWYPTRLSLIPIVFFAALAYNRLSMKEYVESSPESGSYQTLIILYLILGLVAYILSNRLLTEKNRLIRGPRSRIKGLVLLEGLPWEEKVKLIKEEAKKIKKIEPNLD